MYAIYLLQLDKATFRNVHPLQFSLYIAVGSCLIVFITDLFVDTINYIVNLNVLFWLIMVSVLGLTALIFLQIGSRQLGSKLTALFCLFEPLTSIILSVIFLNERMTNNKIIGCILIIIAVSSLAIGQRQSKNKLKTTKQ
ncbi:MAG: EamA family transporter [Erysipelotrichaceae bacterium]